MKSEPTRPEKIALYRNRAEELRATVETWQGEDTIQKILQLADYYDRMADTLETSAEAGS